MNKLTRAERQVRIDLFNELERLEKDINLPEPHIYVDFLGVSKDYQHQGRGKKLMACICRYADSLKLPLMLFTNTADDVKFYQNLGFNITGETSSEKFGFVNTYLTYGSEDKKENPGRTDFILHELFSLMDNIVRKTFYYNTFKKALIIALEFIM